MKQQSSPITSLTRFAAVAVMLGAGALLSPSHATADPVRVDGGIRIGIGLPIRPIYLIRDRDHAREEWREHHRWRREEAREEFRHDRDGAWHDRDGERRDRDGYESQREGHRSSDRGGDQFRHRNTGNDPGRQMRPH